MPVAIEKLLTTAQAAELLEITEECVRLYCRQGRIGTLVGRTWVISEDEVRFFKQIPRPVGRPKSAATNGSNGHG